MYFSIIKYDVARLMHTRRNESHKRNSATRRIECDAACEVH